MKKRNFSSLRSAIGCARQTTLTSNHRKTKSMSIIKIFSILCNVYKGKKYNRVPETVPPVERQ